MGQSFGIILSSENPVIFEQIKQYCEQLPGVRVIYCTRSTERLYITKADGETQR